jgi:hypothetical protein
MSLLLAFQGTPPAEPDYIIALLSEVPEEPEEDIGSTFLLIEDDYISSLESSIDEEETPEGFWFSDLIEDETPPEPLEYLLFLIDEGEEELIVPDGWEYISHSPFDDEPPIVVVTERYNLPFFVTPGRLKSF